MKNQSLLVLIVCSIITSCEINKENQSGIVGEWDVQWVTTPEPGQEPIPGMNYTMNGKIDIDADGTLRLEARGYHNCIFQRDTVQNTLEWRISQDTLFMKNAGDEFEGIPYVIKEVSGDKVKLQLVEDIFLFLTK